MARGAHVGQRVARFDARSAAVNRRAAVFFGGCGVIGVVRSISWDRGGFERGFIVGTAVVALALAAVLAWSAWYIAANLERDMEFWRRLERRHRPRVWRSLVTAFPSMLLGAAVGLAEGWRFSAGVFAAWTCATGAVVIARLAGGIRPSRFEL